MSELFTKNAIDLLDFLWKSFCQNLLDSIFNFSTHKRQKENGIQIGRELKIFNDVDINKREGV